MRKGYWPHLWVHSLSRGGPGGHCRYPVDRVPPHTSSKSRRGKACIRTPPQGPQLRILPPGMGWASALLCVPQHRTLPPNTEGLWRCHVSYSSGPRLPARQGSGAAMCPTAQGPAPHAGGLRYYHAPYDFGSCLPIQRDPTLSRISWYRAYQTLQTKDYLC
jgi:hypothetical protein